MVEMRMLASPRVWCGCLAVGGGSRWGALTVSPTSGVARRRRERGGRVGLTAAERPAEGEPAAAMTAKRVALPQHRSVVCSARHPGPHLLTPAYANAMRVVRPYSPAPISAPIQPL